MTCLVVAFSPCRQLRYLHPSAGIICAIRAWTMARSSRFCALGTLAGLGKRYQIEHYEARHGWAVIDTPAHDPAEAERNWKATLALFAEALGP